MHPATTYSYEPSQGRSYHKAVYAHGVPRERTKTAQIECKVVTEDVIGHKKVVPLHEKKAHYLFKPKEQERVAHEHYHVYEGEDAEDVELPPGRDASIDSESRTRQIHQQVQQQNSKNYAHEVSEIEKEAIVEEDEELEDVTEDDSFARRRAIRRRNKRKQTGKPGKTREARTDNGHKSKSRE